MTLLAAVFLEDGTAGLWADSIATRSSPSNPHFGTTSRGEQVQYRTNVNEDYIETSCKVGRFGERTICGITTSNALFAFQILDLIEPELRAASTVEAIEQRAQKAVLSLSGTPGSCETADIVVLGELDNQVMLLQLHFSRDVRGDYSVTLERWSGKSMRGSALFFGSGNQLFPNGHGFEIGPIIKLYGDGILSSESFPAVVAHFISAEIRRRQQWQATDRRRVGEKHSSRCTGTTFSRSSEEYGFSR